MPESSPAAPPRPFFLARLALAVVLPVIAYASLRPFEGWRDPGRGPFAFWTAPLQLGSAYDALLNVIGYLALAASLVLALYPRLRSLPAFAAGVLLPALCSVLVETAQNYLPGRTASVVDVATNTGGAVLGAALAVSLTPWLVDHRGGSYLRQRWLAPGRLGEIGLVVMGVWGVALFAQRMVPFAVGDIRGNLQREVETGLPAWIYPTVESVVVALNLLLAALVLRLVLAERVDRPRWMLAFAGLALALRLVAQLAFWHAGAALRWLTELAGSRALRASSAVARKVSGVSVFSPKMNEPST